MAKETTETAPDPIDDRPVDLDDDEERFGGAIFVVNLSGTVHSVPPTHPAAIYAQRGDQGFRIATDAERNAALKSWGQSDLIPKARR